MNSNERILYVLTVEKIVIRRKIVHHCRKAVLLILMLYHRVWLTKMAVWIKKENFGPWMIVQKKKPGARLTSGKVQRNLKANDINGMVSHAKDVEISGQWRLVTKSKKNSDKEESS